jgi:hypothetical protein
MASIADNITGWMKWLAWGIWNGLAAPIGAFLRWCNWMGFVIFGFFWTVIKFTWQGLTMLYAHIGAAGEMYGDVSSAIAGNNSGGGFSTILCAANTFIPIDLFFAYMGLALQMWIFWNLYRLVKSWIPTVA